MTDKDWGKETKTAVDELFHLSAEKDRVSMRIAKLKQIKEDVLNELAQRDSRLQAVQLELEELEPELLSLDSETKKAESKAKQVSREYFLEDRDKEKIKEDFKGVFQARVSEKFVVNDKEALSWLYKNRDKVREKQFNNSLKLNKKGFEKLADTLEGEDLDSLESVAEWQEVITMALQKRKLAEWVPADPVYHKKEKDVGKAISRLEEPSKRDEVMRNQDLSNDFLNSPIEDYEPDIAFGFNEE